MNTFSPSSSCSEVTASHIISFKISVCKIPHFGSVQKLFTFFSFLSRLYPLILD